MEGVFEDSYDHPESVFVNNLEGEEPQTQERDLEADETLPYSTLTPKRKREMESEDAKLEAYQKAALTWCAKIALVPEESFLLQVWRCSAPYITSTISWRLTVPSR